MLLCKAYATACRAYTTACRVVSPQLLSILQAHHSTLARLRAELDTATREMQSGGPSASQNRQSLFSHPQGVEGYQTADPDDVSCTAISICVCADPSRCHLTTFLLGLQLEGGQQMERLLSTRAKQEETSRKLEETLVRLWHLSCVYSWHCTRHHRWHHCCHRSLLTG